MKEGRLEGGLVIGHCSRDQRGRGEEEESMEELQLWSQMTLSRLKNSVQGFEFWGGCFWQSLVSGQERKDRRHGRRLM